MMKFMKNKYYCTISNKRNKNNQLTLLKDKKKKI